MGITGRINKYNELDLGSVLAVFDMKFCSYLLLAYHSARS